MFRQDIFTSVRDSAKRDSLVGRDVLEKVLSNVAESIEAKHHETRVEFKILLC